MLTNVRLSALALTCFSTMAAAQTAPRPLTVSLGSSAEAFGIGDGGAFTPGLKLQLGVHVQPRGSQFGLRLNGWFYQQHPENTSDSRQAWSVGLDVTRDLARGATRPYLFAGGGMSQLRAVAGYTLFPQALRWEGRSSFASAGFGVQHKTGPLWLYVEARYAWMFNPGVFGTHVAPLTFGLRF